MHGRGEYFGSTYAMTWGVGTPFARITWIVKWMGEPWSTGMEPKR